MAFETMAMALDGTVRVAAAGAAIGAVETIIDRGAYHRGGPFGPEAFAILRGYMPPALIAAPVGVAAVAAVQAMAATLLVIAGPFGIVGRSALLAVTVATTLIRWRRVLGGDGAEQLSAIIFISATLALLPGSNELRVLLAVTFITAQAVLAYFTAGFAKLLSPIWRSGAAVPAIVNTHGHGLPLATDLFNRFPLLGKFAGWAVMTFELLFPAVLLLPTPGAEGMLVVGLLFHVSCAFVMGLNGFLWAFPATYPCVLACRVALVA